MKPNSLIKEVVLKNGKKMSIKTVSVEDTAAMQKYINTISLEDSYLLVSGEQYTYEQELAYVTDSVARMETGNKIHILSFIDGELVSSAEVRRMIEGRTRYLHVGEIGLSVSKKYRGLGIGKYMMEVLIEYAKKMENMKILRLWVFGDNDIAKALYTKLGFIQCGSIPDGIFRKGMYTSHDLMIKAL